MFSILQWELNTRDGAPPVPAHRGRGRAAAGLPRRRPLPPPPPALRRRAATALRRATAAPPAAPRRRTAAGGRRRRREERGPEGRGAAGGASTETAAAGDVHRVSALSLHWNRVCGLLLVMTGIALAHQREGGCLIDWAHQLIT